MFTVRMRKRSYMDTKVQCIYIYIGGRSNWFPVDRSRKDIRILAIILSFPYLSLYTVFESAMYVGSQSS